MWIPTHQHVPLGEENPTSDKPAVFQSATHCKAGSRPELKHLVWGLPASSAGKPRVYKLHKSCFFILRPALVDEQWSPSHQLTDTLLKDTFAKEIVIEEQLNLQWVHSGHQQVAEQGACRELLYCVL